MFAGLIKIVKKAKNKVKAVLRRRKKSRLFLDSVARRKVQGNASLLPHTLRSAPDARRKAGKKAAPNAEIVLKNFSGVQLSPHTKRAYERDLKEFVFYLKKNQELEAWYLLTPSDLAAYRDHLIGRKFAKASVTRKVAVLKSFYSWAVAQGHLDRNPADTVRTFPQSQDSTTGFLTEEQVYGLLHYLESLNIEARLAHHLAKVSISTLLMLGVRRSEACSLHFEDIEMLGDAWVIRVSGKGGRDRRLPIAPLLAEVLEGWFRRLHPEECPPGNFDENPALWLDFLRRRAKHPILLSTRALTFTNALSDSELARIVRKHCLKAGIPFRVSPHMLRSTAITHALDQGATHRGVQQMAGWTSPLMISRYDKKRSDPKYSAVHQLRYAQKKS